MTLQETGFLLAKIALVENRTATNEQIRAWHEILQDVNYQDAMEALLRHYRNSSESCKPTHIYKGAREVSEEKKKRRFE